MTDEQVKFFYDNFRLTKMGPNLWRAYNSYTHESASPVYNSKEAAINYVLRELKQEMDNNIEQILGGQDVATRLDDDSTFHSRLPISVSGDGTEKI